MTKQEKIIVSAYTGCLMCDMSDVHKYIEKILGRPIWSHELANEAIQREIMDKSRADFLALCETSDDESDNKYGFIKGE